MLLACEEACHGMEVHLDQEQHELDEWLPLFQQDKEQQTSWDCERYRLTDHEEVHYALEDKLAQ